MDGSSKESVRDEVFRFIRSYMEAFDKAPNLGMVARRFGKRTRTRFGCTVEELIQGDERFEVELQESGKTLVGAFPPE